MLALAGALALLGSLVSTVPAAAATPQIITSASASGFPVGLDIFDRATLALGVNPTGTITFNLYGPDDATCSGATAFQSVVTVAGNGDYESQHFTTTLAGIYRWIASYSGDPGNDAVSGACNDSNEQTSVARKGTTLAGQASALSLTGAIHDVATLGSGVNPTGFIRFRLYGPDDMTCGGPIVFDTNVPVNGNGVYTSPDFAPTVGGTYQWVATYLGDVNNVASGTFCNDMNQDVVVTPRLIVPTLTTQASAPVLLGGSVTDTATLAGGLAPTGSIAFRLFGPADTTCTSAPVFAPAAVTVLGNGQYTSPAFSPAVVGTYRWTASYSGDVSHAAVVTACNDPGESVVVNPTGPVTPVLTTQASAGVTLGGQVTDTANLSGGSNPTGTITFTAFGPNDATCASPAASTSTATVAGNGAYPSGPFAPVAAGTYRWVASYGGDANNNPVATACGDPNESVLVSPPGPLTLTTQASASVLIGGQITDTATVSGGTNPTGTVTFSLYGPDDATCTGTAVFTSTVTLSLPTTPSGQFTPTVPGTYRWVASYSGDANNVPVAGACNDPNESVVVAPPPPLSISTQTNPTVQIPNDATDTATVSGGTNPTGTVTFTLYGPNNPTCTGAPIFTSSARPLAGGPPPSANSGPFTVTQPGTYNWVAVYSGDANNPSATSPCGSPNETFTTTAPPTLTMTTQASPSVPTGGQITDTATVIGGNNPTGTVAFTLFGPANPTCTGAPIFTSAAKALGGGPPLSATSDPFTATAAGTYDWVAVYSGDANNPSFTSPCGSPNESVTVSVILTELNTQASPAVQLGTQITDTATVSSTVPATGTVTFTLFGPDDATCAGAPIFTSSARPLGGGPPPGATSEPFTPTAPGTYRWMAVYSGDANHPGASGSCNDPGESVVVSTVAPLTLSTLASPSTGVGAPITDTATLSGGASPTGVITFTLFGPDNATCSGAAIFTSAVAVNGAGTYTSGSFTPTAPGTYRWIGAYGGDANNQPVNGACNATGESVIVSPPVGTSISVDKSAEPTSRPEPGGAFGFSIVVRNTGGVAVTISGLTDDVYGDVSTKGSCTSALGTRLEVGGTYACQFQGDFTGNAGASHTDTVTATAQPDAGPAVTASDTATVTLTNAAPSIAVTNVVSPPSRPEPGGMFDHSVTITNTGAEAVTVSSLVDSVYGDLALVPGSSCATAVDTVLAPGAAYACAFSVRFTSEAGVSKIDVVTATAFDDEGSTATASAAATVVITDVPPKVRVRVEASPSSVPEPGGDVVYTVVVDNISNPEAVHILSLLSTRHGDLNGRGTCATGVFMPAPPAPGSTYTCTFTAPVTGDPGTVSVTRVAVSVVDNEGSIATAVSDPAGGTVTITDVVPTIVVGKTATPQSLPSPGGFFTFVVTVSNSSFEPVTLVSLVDDVHGNLAGQGTCATGASIGPSGTYSCNFSVTFLGLGGERQTDVVTATVVDDDGSQAEGRATATISVQPGAPGTGPGMMRPVEVPAARSVVVPPAQPLAASAVARTGADVAEPALLAGILLFVGVILLGVAWRRGSSGTG